MKGIRMVNEVMLFELGCVIEDRGYEEVGTSDFFALVKELFDVDATGLDLERYLEIDG